MKYIKGNFLSLCAFRDLVEMTTQAGARVMHEAGQPVHGTKRDAALVLSNIERAVLKPLPAIAPDLGTWHLVSVHRACHAQSERVLYSATFTLAGETLWLRATDGAVVLDDEPRHAITHPRGRLTGQRVTVRDHVPPHA